MDSIEIGFVQSGHRLHWMKTFPSLTFERQRKKLSKANLFMGNSTTLNFQPLARALGWFSIGLGLLEICAPRRLAKIIGVKSQPSLLFTLGLREISSGIGILSNRKQKKWLWSRLAGDVIDLSLLGSALGSKSTHKRSAIATSTAVAGIAVLDAVCSWNLDEERSNTENRGIHVRKSVVVNRSHDGLYMFWRDLQYLPLFMSHIESVQAIDEKRSRWKAKAPAGTVVEWDAEIINDKPGELIAWRSIEGSEIENAGTVRFEPMPAGRGTLVKVELQYNPPAGVVGDALAKLFGKSPEQELDLDLRHFKQIMETGEVSTTVGQPAGRKMSTSKKYDYTEKVETPVEMEIVA
jgi:uncharacterized membrane protein